MKKLIYILFSMIVISMLFSTGAYAKKLVYAAVADEMLEMYLSPDNDSVKITDIPGCAELNLLKTEGTWGNVVFANKCGWINMSFTRDSYDEAAEDTGFESVKNVETTSGKNKVDLYTLPSVELKYGSEKKYSVPDGVILKITRETSDGWGLVTMNNEYLWVNLDDTSPYLTKAEQAIENYELYYVYTFSAAGSGIKLYSDPKGKSVVTTIADCVKLTVREANNNYAYVSYNGINGWVNLKDTKKSLSGARANTGKKVNAEYEISGESTSSTDIFNVPSNKIKDGAVSTGSIKSGTRVFVQRCTADGWMLVNYDGNIGWIPPGNAEYQPNDDALVIEPLENKVAGYVSTGTENGLTVYSHYEGNTVAARIPECVRVEVLAEKDGRQYIYCDYASGWAEEGNLNDSYGQAIGVNYPEEPIGYTVKEDAKLMLLPMAELLCGNEELALVEKDTELKILRVVTNGKTKWGLTEIKGKKGWINLAETSKVYSSSKTGYIIAGSVLGILIVALALIFILYKMKKKRKEEAPETEKINETVK